MFIVDSQVHIWEADTPEHPWPVVDPRHEHIKAQPPFLKDDLLREMKAAGVDRVVVIPPSWIGDSNDLALDAARSHPDRFAVMGRLEINAPGARGQLAAWRQQPGMLGLRLTHQFQGNSTEDWLWEGAEKAGVPIMLSPTSLPPHLLERVAERYPGLKLVIDHLGLPRRKKDDEAFAGLDKVLALAQRPNIAVKASGLPHYTADSYPYRRLHPHIRRVYDAFGPKRIFWGSDVTEQTSTYRELVTMFTQEIPWLTATDQEWIMGRGLCEWIGWKLP